MTDVVLFLIGQSVIIVGAILLAYIRTVVKLAVVESNTELMRIDHGQLSIKVDGISRAVARLEERTK